MIPVWKKWIFTVTQPVNNHTYHIKHWYNQKRKSYHNATGKGTLFHWIGHTQTDDHHCQQHPDSERTGITHKDLASPIYLTVYVIIKEQAITH